MKLGISMIGVLAAAFACLIVAGGLTGTSDAGAPIDSDNDGVYDSDDNCVQLYQASGQFCDTNSDGYGNMCDPDVDNNGVANDIGPFKQGFGLSTGETGYDPDLDFDCNGTANDIGTLKAFFGSPPGPSGLSCAGTVPCP